MTFVWPLALVGLVALPILWLLARRSGRPQEVVMPSLLFLAAELDVSPAGRRRLDPHTWLAMAAAALLALAAAGLRSFGEERTRVVRAIVEGGAISSVPSWQANVATALAGLRAQLEPADRLDVVVWPPAGADLAQPRPPFRALEALARAGEADARWILCWAHPAHVPADVRVVALAPSGLGTTWRSTGVVAVGVESPEAAATQDGPARVHATVHHAGPQPATVRLVLERSAGDVVATSADILLAARDARGVTVELPAGLERARLVLQHIAVPEGADVPDLLPADDAVLLVRGLADVYVSPALSPADRELVLAALDASGRMRVVDDPASARCWLGYGAAAALAWARGQAGRMALALQPAGDEPPLAVPGDAAPRALVDARTRDLAVTRTAAAFSHAALGAARAGTFLVGWGSDAAAYPLLSDHDGVLQLAAPLHAGRPRLGSTPFFALLIDNWLRAGLGPDVGGGWVAEGVLDLRTTEARGQADGFEFAALDTPLPRVRAAGTSWTWPLSIAAAACLALLWSLPWLRMRRKGTGRRPAPLRRTS